MLIISKIMKKKSKILKLFFISILLFLINKNIVLKKPMIKKINNSTPFW